MVQVDMKLARAFRVREHQTVEFRWEVFNVPNLVNLGVPNTVLSSGTFGQITSDINGSSSQTGDPRIVVAAMDEDTGKSYGFPLPRRVHARLLDKLRGYGVSDADMDHALRTIRSTMHGFAMLEASRGFQWDADPDESFAWMIGFIDRGLRPG